MAVATVATAATLAYLNARWRLPTDWLVLSTMGKTIYKWNSREKQDRANLFYVIEENATNSQIADKDFLLYEDQRWTFRKFYDSALHYAGWLHATHKVARGEVVAINFMNSPEMLLLATALWSLGATPVLINYNLSGASLEHSIRISAARLMIIEPEVVGNVLTPETISKLAASTFGDGHSALNTVVLDRELQTIVEHFPPFRAPDSARSINPMSYPAVLIATSGTTGLPKQAIVTQRRVFGAGLVASGFCGVRSVATRNPDVFYTPMPLYHGTAFMGGFSLSVGGASTFAIGRRFSVSNFWSDVRHHNATIVQYVGESLRYLNAAPAQASDRDHKVRLAYGNGLRPDVWKQFKARFGIETIVEFYGATEGTFATFSRSQNDFSDGAVGQTGELSRLIMSRSLAIVKLDEQYEEPLRDTQTGFCVKVATGQPGEMISKIDAKNINASFPGYYGNQKATQGKVLRNVFVKDDAWFRTGDVMRWDAEGLIWFSDRIGDTFRWKSENVSTMEVGEVVGHHPEVIEANIYGVSVPGYEGRAGCAAIVFKDLALEEGAGGTTVRPEVLKGLAVHARKSLQKAAVPVFIRVVKEMAVTGNNKTLKHALRIQGVDAQAIQAVGSGDQLYWLAPGAESYVKFEPKDWTALSTGKARL